MSPQERGAHTAGPWTANPLDRCVEENSVYAPTLPSGERRLVASVSTGARAFANARLIAAAPDLLASLQAAMTILGDSVGDFDYDAACAAIAKATGTQP